MSPSLKPATRKTSLKPAAPRKNGVVEQQSVTEQLPTTALKPSAKQKRLTNKQSEAKQELAIKVQQPDVQLQSPYHRCSLYGAALVGAEVYDPDFCIHGPQGCISTLKEGFAIQGKEIEYHTSGMSKDDIVFGGEETLYNSVAEILAVYEHAGPKFVITSCSSEIIGDNVNSVLDKFNPGLPSLTVKGGGVNGDQYRGINNTLFGLVSRFANPKAEKVDKRVNLIGNIGLSREWRGDYYELVRLLELLDIEVNRVGCDSTIENYNKASSAAATILVNYEIGAAAAGYLEEQYNIPTYTSSLFLPLGLRGTEIWLREIGKIFDIPRSRLDELIDEEEYQVRGALKVGLNQTTFIENLISIKSLPCAIIAEGSVAFSWARFVSEELEMKPVYIGLRTGADDARLREAFEDWRKRLYHKPEITPVGTYADIEEGLETSKAEYVFGSSVELDLVKQFDLSGALHITHPNMHYITVTHRPYLGYKGVVNASEAILNSTR